MERDERRESGEWYPGGRSAQGGGEGGGGEGASAPSVPVTKVEELPARYREGDLRDKVNELARIVSGKVG